MCVCGAERLILFKLLFDSQETETLTKMHSCFSVEYLVDYSIYSKIGYTVSKPLIIKIDCKNTNSHSQTEVYYSFKAVWRYQETRTPAHLKP